MHIENVNLKQAHQVALDKKDISHHQALVSQRQKTHSLLAKKDHQIKRQKTDLDAYQELAFEVAVESQETLTEAAKTTRESKKKVAAAEATATKRLHKFKDAAQEIQSL